MRETGRYRPWIWRRMLLSALISAIIPVFVIALLLFTLSDNGASFSAGLSDEVRTELNDQFLISTRAQADRISERLHKIGFNVEMLREYSVEILISQEIYAQNPWGMDRPVDEVQPGEGSPDPAISQERTSNSGLNYLENPIYYSKSNDGALRKIIDDGGSVIYYRKPSTNRDFTHYEQQKLQVTARLDALLKGPARMDSLVSHAYIVTNDSMLRSYPFLDVSTWPGDKDLTKPAMYAWSPDKANEDGLVWTSPYVSHLSGEWVIGCLGNVEVGSSQSRHQAAVVGCEIKIANLMDEMLALSIGSGGISWLYRGKTAPCSVPRLSHSITSG